MCYIYSYTTNVNNYITGLIQTLTSGAIYGVIGQALFSWENVSFGWKLRTNEYEENIFFNINISDVISLLKIFDKTWYPN